MARASAANLSLNCDVISIAMKTKITLTTKLARTVAGEDLVQGDFVATMMERVDVPSYVWNNSGYELSPHELVSLQLTPENAGQPLKVFAICLPFVYVKTAHGGTMTIDTRTMRLVRLGRQCAKVVWKQLRPKRKRRKKAKAK